MRTLVQAGWLTFVQCVALYLTGAWAAIERRLSQDEP